MEESATMHAAFIERLGPPEHIRYGELPAPRPGPTDVLVDVLATTVNPVDTFVRSGVFRTPMDFPFVISRDLVGVVAAAGPGAPGFAVGDLVWCNSLGHGGRQGAAADQVVVPVDRLYHLPDGVLPTDAVTVVHPAATAYLGGPPTDRRSGSRGPVGPGRRRRRERHQRRATLAAARRAGPTAAARDATTAGLGAAEVGRCGRMHHRHGVGRQHAVGQVIEPVDWHTTWSAARPCRPPWPRLLHHTRSPTANRGRRAGRRDHADQVLLITNGRSIGVRKTPDRTNVSTG